MCELETITSEKSSEAQKGMVVPQYRLQDTAQSRASRNQLANLDLTNPGTVLRGREEGMGRCVCVCVCVCVSVCVCVCVHVCVCVSLCLSYQ